MPKMWFGHFKVQAFPVFMVCHMFMEHFFASDRGYGNLFDTVCALQFNVTIFSVLDELFFEKALAYITSHFMSIVQ